MTKARARSTHSHLFSGGGEMGQLVRDKDWSDAPIGPPETWPQSLKTTLGILLNSKFPMALWWGTELICFYNDAYRTSLGSNGKHPSILGRPAREAWPEIWDTIQPLIDEVRTTGEVICREDQLTPIYRNGEPEEVYWTFSYSPIADEIGNIEGILIACNETPQKVIKSNNMLHSQKRFLKTAESSDIQADALLKKEGERFRNVANNAPVLIWMSDNRKFCHFFNSAWLEFTGRTLAQEQGQGWTQGVHPEDLEQSLATCRAAFERREEFYMEYRLLRYDGQYRWISEKAAPHFTANGEFEGFIGACMDIHEKVVAEQQLKENEAKLNIIIEASELAT